MDWGFCVSFLSDCAATLVIDCVVKPVRHHLGYLYRFHDNKEKLKGKKDELTTAQCHLQRKIKEADDQLLQADDEKDLLSKVEKIVSDMETLEKELRQNKRCFYWCPNWSWSYQLSKKAKEKTQDAMELLEETKNLGQSRQIAYRRPAILPDIGFLCSEDFEFSKSSKKAFDQIIEALKDDNISKIGLWGMGGVGKTTLVREVGKQAKELNLFDEVALATVSQKPDFEAIQKEIAKCLGFLMEDERGRRSELLWVRLKKEKRILIILDDVWEDINLKEQIGIPLGKDHKGCKILLTTRRQQVCFAMDCRELQLGCLDRHEAWALFSKKAGLNDSCDAAIKDVANQIIQKCEGLPIAIVTLGSALKGKTLHGWKAAYRRLKTRRLTEIEDVKEKNVYLCLEASFDYLANEETKICFLLCSLFPEDFEIYVEDLVRYAWGLELHKSIGSIESIEELRSDVLAAIDNLKNSSLLQGCREGYVKMHDMVRDVALRIASSKKGSSFGVKFEVVETWPKDKSFKHYTGISFWSRQVSELPKRLLWPNLKILLLRGKYGRHMTTSNEFFEEMKALKVCALSNILISPAAFQFQTNLRTLRLEECILSDISILGKLRTLQVLSFKWCGIIELPNEIGELENLRLLDLSDCKDLRRIPPHLIRRLSNLEELYMHGCSSLKWATENATEEENYSSLSELKSLPNLAALSLDLSSEHIPKGFVFRKLQRFDVYIGIQRGWSIVIFPVSRSLKIEASVLNACRQLFQDVESLEMRDLVGHRNLVPGLELDQGDGNGIVLALPSLRELKMQNCPQLTSFTTLAEIQVQQGLNHLVSLQSLKVVEITKCNSLKYLFPTSAANSLGQLETLQIQSCSGLEEIIQTTDVSNISLQSLREVHVVECNSLRSLKFVELDSCNNMKYLFPTSVANSLGQLETLRINSCSRLEEIIQATDVSNISLQSLREVHVVDCNKLTSLSTLSHGQSLENLRNLEIRDCCRLEYTFPFSMIEGLPQLNEVCLDNLPQCKGRDGNDIVLTLSSLQMLGVFSCPQLTPCIILAEIQVQQGLNRHLSFHSLKVIKIRGCNNLRYLFPMSVADSLGQLEKMVIVSCLGLEEIIQATTVSEISLKSLKEVYVIECNNLKSLSSLSHGHRLKNLTKLWIRDCLQLEYTFSNSMAEGLPKLSEIRLRNLPQLKGKDGNDIVLTLPSLQDLRVINCPQLTPFIISAKIQDLEFGRMEERKQMCNMTVPVRSANMFDSGYNLPSMRSLFLKELPELRVIWKGPIQVVNFQNLTRLVVRNCRRLRYIFSPIIARNLPQLSWLDIYGCEELEQIIEKDQTSSQDRLQPFCFPNLTYIVINRCENLKCLFPITVAYCGLPKLEQLNVQEVSNLEQVFEEVDEANVSNDKQKVIELPQLKSLRLEKLSNLVSFSPVGYHFIFSSLDTLWVKGCPNITTSFSVDSNKSTHAKTEASQSSDGTIVEESGTSQETTWPIGGDIGWRR